MVEEDFYSVAQVTDRSSKNLKSRLSLLTDLINRSSKNLKSRLSLLTGLINRESKSLESFIKMIGSPYEIEDRSLSSSTSINVQENAYGKLRQKDYQQHIRQAGTPGFLELRVSRQWCQPSNL